VHRVLLRHRDGGRWDQRSTLFGKLIDDASASKHITGIATGYFIGAALMIIAGVVEAFLGVRAEGQALETIAQPLTVDDEGGDTEDADARTDAPAPNSV
jgi:hypothetical protein